MSSTQVVTTQDGDPGVRVPQRRRRPFARLTIALCVGVGLFLVATLFVTEDRREPGSAPPVPYASGLTWSSGVASKDNAAFARWRGRPLDNTTTWPNRETWQVIADPDRYGAISEHAGSRLLTIGMALLPEQQEASFADCAAGFYDQWFALAGRRLVELGRGDAIVRLGWEANGDWYAWSIGDQVVAYRDCFRSAVAALRSTAPSLVIDWNMTKDSHMVGSVADAYPGDDVVDIIGVDFYDMYPAYPTRAAWQRDYMATQNGGPRGIGTWLEFARAHGKKLSIPEWGLNNGVGGGTDNPLFMQLMHEFFSRNADDIAYETYFNLQDPGFVIQPAGINPTGSAEYRRLWQPR